MSEERPVMMKNPLDAASAPPRRDPARDAPRGGAQQRAADRLEVGRNHQACAGLRRLEGLGLVRRDIGRAHAFTLNAAIPSSTCCCIRCSAARAS